MIVVSNLIQYLLKPAGFRQGDSWAYGFSGERDWGLVSFTGHALRKWPLVLVNTILGNVELQVLFQTLFSCCAWIFLVCVISKLYGSNNLAVLATGVLGSIKQIVSWNSIQLSESWSISSLIMVIALSLSISYKRSRTKILLLLMFLLITLNTKPSTLLALVVLIPLILLGMALLKQTTRLRKNESLTLAIIGIVVYSCFLNVNQANENLQNEGSGQSYSAAQAVAVISNINPEAKRVISKLSTVDEITCLDITALKSPIEITELMKFKCQTSESWLTENFAKWYLRYLIENPQYVMKIFATSLSAGNSPFSMYAGSISIVPTPVEGLFFGSRNYANRLNQDSAQNIDVDKIEITSPLFVWIIAGLLLLTYLTFRTRFIRSDGPRVPGSTYGLLICLGLITILISGVLIPNEWFRQSIVGQIEIFVGTILLYAEYSTTNSLDNTRTKNQ
jgi:hypothetical protein